MICPACKQEKEAAYQMEDGRTLFVCMDCWRAKMKKYLADNGPLAKKVVRHLPCVLTNDDIKLRNRELLRALNNIDSAEAAARRLRRELADGEVYRRIECLEVRDYANGRVVTHRLDTGDRVDDRPMTDSESVDFEEVDND